nr:immunoglobulin lambda-1 light chain-like [Anolis sagrei ordinatus]
MTWSLLFLVLFDFYVGVHSQGILTQPASVSGSPGQTVTLSCTKGSGSWVSYVSWYQQKSGEGPRFVHCSICGSNRGPGIPDRFTATASGDTSSLTITNVQVGDEADYYCAWWYSTDSSYHGSAFSWGSKTKTAASPPPQEEESIASQPTLTQVPFQSVTLGNTVRLTTTLSSSHANYVVSWYQQREGQAPRLVLDTSNNRGSGISERFSGSKSGSERYLTITNVLAEDEATYYCAADHGSGSSFTFFCFWKICLFILNTMAWALLLFSILVAFDPSFQQLQTLKDSESVAQGGTVTLSCRYNSGTIGDSNYPWWTQHVSGSKPRMVMHSTSTRPSGVPDRFSGSRSGNVMSLTITGALAEDEAVYYCVVWTGSE